MKVRTHLQGSAAGSAAAAPANAQTTGSSELPTAFTLPGVLKSRGTCWQVLNPLRTSPELYLCNTKKNSAQPWEEKAAELHRRQLRGLDYSSFQTRQAAYMKESLCTISVSVLILEAWPISPCMQSCFKMGIRLVLCFIFYEGHWITRWLHEQLLLLI